MRQRRIVLGVTAGLAAVILCASVVLADTCCANTAVGFHPATALPGHTVHVDGIACLNPDNTGPLELNLVGFWLSRDRVPADSDPGSQPGSGGSRPANDLPAADEWLPFAAVTGTGVAASGSATIVVPQLASGTYQLWWLCDNDAGPGSGIHYSGGPRLTVGPDSPDTATIDPNPGRPSSGDGITFAAIAAGALILMWSRFPGRRRTS